MLVVCLFLFQSQLRIHGFILTQDTCFQQFCNVKTVGLKMSDDFPDHLNVFLVFGSYAACSL